VYVSIYTQSLLTTIDAGMLTSKQLMATGKLAKSQKVLTFAGTLV
jgi:hypothetical protein